MDENGFIKAKHSVTGIVSKVPSTYLTVYPDVFVVMSDEDMALHNAGLEEAKTIYALDEPVVTKEPGKPARKKEGK